MLTIRNDQIKSMEQETGPGCLIHPCPPFTWIAIQLLDASGNPVPSARYRIKLPDGRVVEGKLDQNGSAVVRQTVAGECEVSFPDLEKSACKSLT